MSAWIGQKARPTLKGFPIPRKARGRWQRILISLKVVGFVLLVLATLFSASYVLPLTYESFSCGDALKIILTSSKNLSSGDEEEILVTVVNTSDKNLSEVLVQLVYSDTIPLATGLEDGNSLKFKELMAGEMRSGKIKVKPLFRVRSSGLPPWEPPNGSVKFNVKVKVNGQPLKDTDEYSLNIAPVPKIRWVLKILGGFTLSLILKWVQAQWKAISGISA